MSNTVDRRIIGDTQHAVSAICYLNGQPYDWAGKTASTVLEAEDGTAVVEAGITTAHPTQTVTLDSTNNWIKCNRHGMQLGDQVRFTTSGSLSGTGLDTTLDYIVVETTPFWFRVALTPNTVGITIAGAGSGAHTVTIVGSIQYAYDPTEVQALKRIWFKSTSGGKDTHFPAAKQGATVDIQALGN